MRYFVSVFIGFVLICIYSIFCMGLDYLMKYVFVNVIDELRNLFRFLKGNNECMLFFLDYSVKVEV